MEAIRKQASKLREQVARQQQAILRQLGQLGHGGVMIDKGDIQIHHDLHNLYKSTRAAKHFQRDIVRGLEGFISTSKKQMEIVKKLAEDCCKYGIENRDSNSPVAKIASGFGTSHASMEDHREVMLGFFGYQVAEPLHAQTKGAPLEDAHHLTHRYDRLRQEFELQTAEVMRRQSKSSDTSTETASRLKIAEKKLTELKSSMVALGREATNAMLSVQHEQQELTFQKLLALVDAERSYHQNVITILEKLHSEMQDTILQPETPTRDDNIPSSYNNPVSKKSYVKDDENQSLGCFVAKAMHPFDAQADGELNLEVDDYVLVQQVCSNGWSEGECKGKAGWFPSAYVVKTDDQICPRRN